MKYLKNLENIQESYFEKCFLIILALFIFTCSSNPTNNNDDEEFQIPKETNETFLPINLNIRIHIMKDIVMQHSTGTSMDSWVTPEDIRETVMPEVNSIWEQANVKWNIESIIEEDVVKTSTYSESVNFLVNTKRNDNGNSDPTRLPHLFSLMQPQYMSKDAELGKNLFHIYLFPFIGNTSQGNAMRGFNFHSVVGTWTNKFNGGGIPEKTLLIENQSSFDRGSLSRTISHEVGHVLNLSHNECSNKCLMGGTISDGYLLNESQIIKARIEASNRRI